MNSLLNRRSIVFTGFILIAGYFLWTEHSAHIQLAFPYLPYLLLLLCPLLHIFMHGGHGHGHGHRHGEEDAHNATRETARDVRPENTNESSGLRGDQTGRRSNG
jgi:hypothetical protein